MSGRRLHPNDMATIRAMARSLQVVCSGVLISQYCPFAPAILPEQSYEDIHVSDLTMRPVRYAS